MIGIGRIYYGVAFYALGISNVAEFHSGCGERVWPFMLAHTFISWFIALESYVAAYSNLSSCVGLSDDFIFQATMATTAVFCGISLAVGVPILSREQCVCFFHLSECHGPISWQQ